MRVTCQKCGNSYDDEFSWCVCPHNPLEASHEAGAYCRRHDKLAPCPFCKNEELNKLGPVNRKEQDSSVIPPTANLNPEMYQVVTLILADGRKASYTGRYQIDPDVPSPVVDVLVSPAKPLPANCSFETIQFQGGQECLPKSETGASNVESSLGSSQVDTYSPELLEKLEMSRSDLDSQISSSPGVSNIGDSTTKLRGD